MSKNPPKASILLINDGNESTWSATLRESLVAFGRLKIIKDEEAATEIQRAHYDLIIVDATTVQEPVKLVSRLHAYSTSIRFVVTSVTPTWQEAREVFRAGAVDYVRRSIDKEELLSVIQNAFDLSAPTRK